MNIIAIILTSISLLTWNTHQLGRTKPLAQNEVVRYLQEQDADIVCLEEVEVRKDGLGISLSQLKQAMAQYPYTYLDFKIYNSRRQYGNVVFSRYPLVNKQTLRYESRGNISSRCDVVIGEDTVRLMVNYLETNRLHDEDLGDTITTRNVLKATQKFMQAESKRKDQAEVIAEAIESSPYPVICVGDMNTLPHGPTYNILTRKLQDCYNKANLLRWGGTCQIRGLWVRIDYILADKRMRVESCEVIKASGSDHLPIRAHLAW